MFARGSFTNETDGASRDAELSSLEYQPPLYATRLVTREGVVLAQNVGKMFARFKHAPKKECAARKCIVCRDIEAIAALSGSNPAVHLVPMVPPHPMALERAKA